MASSKGLNIHSNRLVLARYRDHTELRNVIQPFHVSPSVREAVGWIIYEEDDYMVLLSDRSIDSITCEVPFNLLILIKSNVLELREIK